MGMSSSVGSQTNTQSQPSAKAIFAVAFNLYQSGQFAAAASAFERGLAVEPNNGKAHYDLGDALEHMGDQSQALEHYKQARWCRTKKKAFALPQSWKL